MSKNGSAYHRLLNTSRWRSLRAALLSSRPFCADCAKEGVLEAATDVHHIVPVDEGSDLATMTRLAYDSTNLVGLCHHCHVRRHVELDSHKRGTAAERARKEGRSFWDRLLRRDPGGDF